MCTPAFFGVVPVCGLEPAVLPVLDACELVPLDAPAVLPALATLLVLDLLVEPQPLMSSAPAAARNVARRACLDISQSRTVVVLTTTSLPTVTVTRNFVLR